ncbi:hypothetical protein BX600DRAFT_509657 [Xylariales sp. PMI_506]|nr:hypothetical protein BX600DRAFT_509657 [Xylariales sp. PMI_506]
MAEEEELPVLIIGGGLAGLALAQGLAKLNIPFKVFEKDPSVGYRAQGYRIRISTDSLERVLSPAVTKQLLETCALAPNGMSKYDAQTGEALPAPPGVHEMRRQSILRGHSATADRRVLRDVLMTGGVRDRVTFGKIFSRYEVDEAGEGGGGGSIVTAHFTDGSSERGRLLVGADGRNSRVTRQLVPAHVLLDTETRLFYGKTPVTPELSEVMERRGWTGMQLAEDERSRSSKLVLLTERIRWTEEARSREADKGEAGVHIPPEYVYWVLCAQASSLPWAGDEADRIASEGVAAAAAAVLELTGSWDADTRLLLERQDTQHTAMFPIYSNHPDMPAWEPNRLVTLMGDAVHTMPPTAAAGANIAFKDVEALIETIEKYGIEGLSRDVIGEYEQRVRTTAAEGIRLGFMGGMRTFGVKPLEECKPVQDKYKF